MRRRVAASTLILTIGLIFFSGGCQQKEKPIEWTFQYQKSDWPLKNLNGTLLETEHYKIYTTVEDEKFHEVASLLAELQYRRFVEMIPRTTTNKMTIYIFSNTPQWIAFTKAKFPPPIANQYLKIRNGGYASDNFAAFYYMGRFPTLTIMAHEIFHLYLNATCNGEPIPAWINEGLACYFEAHEWSMFEPIFIPTKNLFRQQNLASAMVSAKRFSFKELLSVNAGIVCNSDNTRMLNYYAQLWGLIQFLQDPESGYAEQFETMVSKLGTREMTMWVNGYLTTCSASEKVSFGEAMFRAYITEDLDTFEIAMNDFLKKKVNQ